MHLQPFGSFGPRGVLTRRRKTGGHDLYGYVYKAFDKVNHGCLLQSCTSSDSVEAASCIGLALT